MTTSEYFSIPEEKQHEPVAYHVELINLSTATFLPGYDSGLPFSHSSSSVSLPYSSPIPLDASFSIDEVLPRRFLRYLSPEMLGSSSCVPLNDESDGSFGVSFYLNRNETFLTIGLFEPLVFAFGVFAYELAVGQLIEPMQSLGIDLLSDIQ